jgi:nitrite reductase/ring-hydroxylating ferredoxin subunit
MLRRSRAKSIDGRGEERRLSFRAVARLEEIPDDSGLRVVVDELAIGLYRVGGEIHAMEDACPHAGFSLSRGRLCDGIIVCGAHALPFDVRTGFRPGDADGFPIPCFAVRVVGETVEVDIGVRTNEPPRPSRRSPGRSDD